MSDGVMALTPFVRWTSCSLGWTTSWGYQFWRAACCYGWIYGVMGPGSWQNGSIRPVPTLVWEVVLVSPPHRTWLLSSSSLTWLDTETPFPWGSNTSGACPSPQPELAVMERAPRKRMGVSAPLRCRRPAPQIHRSTELWQMFPL